MVILEVVVCGAVELYCVMLRSVSTIYTLIDMDGGEGLNVVTK